MSDPATKPPVSWQETTEKRGSTRTPWRETVTMELENGEVLLGMTRDVSVNGAFVEIPSSTSNIHEGDRGVLALAAMDEIIAIFCQVTRISNEGVGVLLQDGADVSFSTDPAFHIRNELCVRFASPKGMPFLKS